MSGVVGQTEIDIDGQLIEMAEDAVLEIAPTAMAVSVAMLVVAVTAAGIAMVFRGLRDFFSADEYHVQYWDPGDGGPEMSGYWDDDEQTFHVREVDEW